MLRVCETIGAFANIILGEVRPTRTDLIIMETIGLWSMRKVVRAGNASCDITQACISTLAYV
jgi:hypothetical protein